MRKIDLSVRIPKRIRGLIDEPCGDAKVPAEPSDVMIMRRKAKNYKPPTHDNKKFSLSLNKTQLQKERTSLVK